jgi:hypothetical protein
VYPLHAYIALLEKQLSDEVGKAVWLRQRNMFDAINNDFSQSMESAFMLIDSALELDNNSPETSVALALLLGMPESPDYASCMKERTDRIQTMQAGVESHLARCLLYAREELLAACSRLFPYKQTGLLQVDDEPCNGEDS